MSEKMREKYTIKTWGESDREVVRYLTYNAGDVVVDDVYENEGDDGYIVVCHLDEQGLEELKKLEDVEIFNLV